jgi:hypothetical protein
MWRARRSTRGSSARSFRLGRLLLEDVAGAHQHRERAVELVGDPGDELAQRRASRPGSSAAGRARRSSGPTTPGAAAPRYFLEEAALSTAYAVGGGALRNCRSV